MLFFLLFFAFFEPSGTPKVSRDHDKSKPRRPARVLRLPFDLYIDSNS